MIKRTISLRRTWDRIRTVPDLGSNVAVLAAVIVLGLGALTYILGNQGFRYPWTESFQFTADFTEAGAVNPDQHPKVRIAGVEVGEITAAEPTQNGHARLTIAVDPGHTIYDNAHLVLRPKNPLNEMYVDIDPGGPPGKPLPPGGTIPASQTERPIQPDQVLSHLDGRSRAALSHLLSMSNVALANAPQHLPAGVRSTDAAVVKFKPIMKQLRTRQETIRELVTALSRISAAVGENDSRLTELANSMQRVLGTMSHRSDALTTALRELPDTTDQLRNAMGSTQTLTEQLNPTLDNVNKAASTLPQALQRMSTTMDHLGKTVRSAKPFVANARPVVSELRPLVGDMHGALGSLSPISRELRCDTNVLVPYLQDVMAFFYNTKSTFSLSDANGGFIRGHATVPLPDGGLVPGTHGGHNGKIGGGCQ